MLANLYIDDSFFIIAQTQTGLPDNFNAKTGKFAVESPGSSAIFVWESYYES